MSDETPQPPTPPGKPSTKTSTVPLKKETVRITLRAKPGAEGAPPPAPAGAAAAPRPPAPAPAPPAPPAPPAAPAPPGAPAPPAPVGAKTVPLTPAPPAAAAPGAPVAQATARLQPAPGAPGPGTRPLPKATVKLQPTQPVSSAPGAPGASISSTPLASGRLSGELDDEKEESGIMPFAAICLVLALAAFAVELLGSQKVFKQDASGSPSFAVPAPDYAGNNRYEKENRATGELNLGYNFDTTMKEDLMNIETYDDYKVRNK